MLIGIPFAGLVEIEPDVEPELVEGICFQCHEFCTGELFDSESYSECCSAPIALNDSIT